jgi:hypothetical protein
MDSVYIQEQHTYFQKVLNTLIINEFGNQRNQWNTQISRIEREYI